ncbi:MAG: hypothetical protein RR806_01445 [Oscillospiraceae bacterium]
MKKITLVILSVIIVLSLAACGKGADKAIGTWYSTKDTLTIKENNKYTSAWLTSGLEWNYSKDGNTYTFISPYGSTYAFEYIDTGNQKTLYYESSTSDLTRIYYDNKEQADKVKEEQEAAAQEEKKEQEEKAATEATNALVGTWAWEWGNYDRTITFNSDNTYVGTVVGMESGKYEIVDSKNVMIERSTGEKYNQPITITKNDSTYKLKFGILNLVKK